MKYYTYRTTIEEGIRIYKHAMKKNGNKVKQKGMALMKHVLKTQFEKVPDTLLTLDYTIQSEEYAWMESKRTVYYPENLSLSETMKNVTCKISDASLLINETDIFVLAFPKNLKFSNMQCEGALVTIEQYNNRFENILKPFYNFVQPNIPNVKFEKHYNDEFLLAICYHNPVDERHVYSRVCLLIKNVDAYLQCKTWQEWNEYIRDNNQYDKSYKHVLKISGNQAKEFEFELLKYILNFLIYKKALPDRVRSGLPIVDGKTVPSKDLSTPLLKKRNHTVITMPESDSKRGTHYRSWHFRQLMHEKYYKGEHVDKQRGSRIVFVRDTQVGKAEAFTVEN